MITADHKSVSALLVLNEGFRSMPYRDSEGYWTIGIGHLISLDAGIDIAAMQRLVAPLPWTLERARAQLIAHVTSDIYELQHAIPKIWQGGMFPNKFVEPVQLGLVDLCYNLGITRLMRFRKMLAALRAGDRTLALGELRNSKWRKQVGANRYNRIDSLWYKGELKGVYP